MVCQREREYLQWNELTVKKKYLYKVRGTHTLKRMILCSINTIKN